MGGRADQRKTEAKTSESGKRKETQEQRWHCVEQRKRRPGGAAAGRADMQGKPEVGAEGGARDRPQILRDLDTEKRPQNGGGTRKTEKELKEFLLNSQNLKEII